MVDPPSWLCNIANRVPTGSEFISFIIGLVFSIRRLLHTPTVPAEYRANFTHLYFDMFWFGILSGSAMNFLNIYAARLGASGFQIGMLGAASAIVNLAVTMPAGQLLARRPVGRTVFWNSILYRIGYLLWIPLPWIFSHTGQIWALICLTFLMGIPLTVLSVGFNTLFAGAVPVEWRPFVAGMRNAVFSITYMVSSLGSGWLLNHLAFPVGYQVVFGIGGLAALLSSVHLFFIRIVPALTGSPQPNQSPGKDPPEPRRSWRLALRTDIWKTPYAAVLLVMLGLHLTQYLAIPVFPLFNVNALHLTDQQIGFGTALFYFTCLLGSTQLNSIVRKLGHHKVTAFGFMGLSLYPLTLGFSHHVAGYYIASCIGGASWSLVGGAYANYILENIPEHDRPAHLAWYNIVLNISILLGSLIGPLIASFSGLGLALVLFALLRLLAGTALLRWGKKEPPGREEYLTG